jgi:TonB family protein
VIDQSLHHDGARNFIAGCVSNEGVTPWSSRTLRISAALIVVCGLSPIVVGQVTRPRKIKDVRPVYPSAALEAGDEGVVLLELNVTASGTVGEARILWSQCKRLEQAAVTAARQWQYDQLPVNGKPVPFNVVADVPFRLPARFKERAGRTGACEWKEAPKPITE